jgi:hypothetical protein
MSHNASAHALRQRLPAMEKWLLFNLGDRADDWGGSIFMAYETLEEKTGMSRPTLKRMFRKLIKRQLVELEVKHTPVSPPFYRMLGVPEPAQVRRQDDTCPQALRRAAIYVFAQRCEFCGRHGMKEWGPDGKVWQIVQLEPDKYAGRPTADNVTLACQTCERKKHRSLEGVRSLVDRQREPATKSFVRSLFDEESGARGVRGQVDPRSEGGFNLTRPGGQIDPGVGSIWPEGGVNLNPPPPKGGVNLTPDPCIDSSIEPSTDPDPRATRVEDPAATCAEPMSSPECSPRHPEQRREHARAASRDVATDDSGWCRQPDRATLDAYVATLPIPGMFASAKLARKVGYQIFDANPGAIFDAHVTILQAALEAKGIATSERQCELAMADVYAERSMRDRAWDAAADRERRRGRW